MEVTLDESITTEEVLDKSIKLLRDVYDLDQPKFRRSPANSFQQDKFFNKSRMADVLQSTKLRIGRDSPSNMYDSELSITMPGEVKKINDSKSFLSGKFVNPIAKSAQDQLFTDFMEAWQRASSSEQDVFGCLLEYIQYCTDAIGLIKESEENPLARLSPIDERRLRELESEKNTWRLIYSIYQDRLMSTNDDDVDEEMAVDFELENISEKEIMERLYKNEASIREWQLVIDWLEGNASEGERGPGLEGYTDKTVAWENTLHEMQNKRAVPYRSTREFVTELDPDAPRRQNKHLHDMDQEDEDRLTQHVLKEIRCGRLEEAQAICVHAGQPWRAAILEGWKLYHDPNYSKVHNPVYRETLPVEGNPNRDIWKLCAWRMCEDVNMPVRARAAIAAYCGHLPSLLAVSSSWEDYLWSYLRTLVDIRVEQEIRHQSFKTNIDMPPNYWNKELNIEAVFSEISANKDANVRREALAPDHVVHRAVILDRIHELKDDVSKWISGSDMSVGGDVESVSPHFLRFLAHFVLFLRHIGRRGVDEIADSVIEAYVKLLIEKRECELVAWYVSQLRQDDQIYYYSAFLEEITEPEEREAALKAALQAGLNVPLITKTVVENIRQQPCNADSTGLEIQELTPEDRLKISALDWLRMYTSQRAELLVQANALIASFLTSNNIFAAKEAFKKIPEDTIGTIQPNQSVLENDSFINMAMDHIPKNIVLATKEYLCYKTYLDSEESFSDWFQHFHHGKPVEPILNPGYTFIEKVGYQHKYNQYKIDLERWKVSMKAQTTTTKGALFNVLLFPMGWLMDDDPDEPERTEQLNALRCIIIPKVTSLLHMVMHDTEDYAGCVALADVIACPHRQLYKVFNKQRLQDLLQKIARSSLALMNEEKDPWGFPLD